MNFHIHSISCHLFRVLLISEEYDCQVSTELWGSDVLIIIIGFEANNNDQNVRSLQLCGNLIMQVSILSGLILITILLALFCQ